MIVRRPDIARRYLRVQTLALGGLGWRAHLNPDWPVWPWRAGAGVLLHWSGERLPYPSLDFVRGGRNTHVVGIEPGLSGVVQPGADLALGDGVHHFAVVAFGPGGVPAEIDPAAVQTVVYDGGQWVGRIANTPALVQVRRLPGDLPHVSWVYSRYSEPEEPAEFQVFWRDALVAWNFAAPLASVAFVRGQTRYSWTGTAMSAGTVRWYTVRTATAAGTLGLIPRNGRAPAPDYNDVPKEKCARLEIPAGPPVDLGTLGLEVFADV